MNYGMFNHPICFARMFSITAPLIWRSKLKSRIHLNLILGRVFSQQSQVLPFKKMFLSPARFQCFCLHLWDSTFHHQISTDFGVWFLHLQHHLENPMLFLGFHRGFPTLSDHTFDCLPSSEIWSISERTIKVQSQIWFFSRETFNVIFSQKRKTFPHIHIHPGPTAHTKNTSTHGKTPMATQAQATKEKQQASNEPCNGPCKSCQEIEGRTTATRRWHDHIHLAPDEVDEVTGLFLGVCLG